MFLGNLQIIGFIAVIWFVLNQLHSVYWLLIIIQNLISVQFLIIISEERPRNEGSRLLHFVISWISLSWRSVIPKLIEICFTYPKAIKIMNDFSLGDFSSEFFSLSHKLNWIPCFYSLLKTFPPFEHESLLFILLRCFFVDQNLKMSSYW